MDNKQLDMVLEYLNTGSINEGFFNKFKKKKPRSGKLGTLQKSSQEIDQDELIKQIEKIEKKLLTSAYKKKMTDELNDFIDDTEYTTKNLPKLIAGDFETGVIEIIDGSQEECIALKFVLSDIITELKKLPQYKNVNFGTGDGDEGCIYF